MVKGHWTSTIIWNRDQVIKIAIIDFSRYWEASLFSQFGHIVRCIKDVVCNHGNVLSYRFTNAFMREESILTPCQKSMLQLFQNNIPAYTVHQYSFILHQGWHIYIEGVSLFLILCSPCIIISIGYLQENEG